MLTKLQKQRIKEILDKNRYKGPEILMNPYTGSTDTARQWATEYAIGFKTDGLDGESHEWDCEICKDEDSSKIGHTCESPEEQFESLIHVRKNRNGDYVEV